MKVILYMAMSVNGMIARANNQEDFLSDENWYEFCKLAKKSGCFVIGRKTYDVVKYLYKDYNFEDVKAHKIVVTSKKKSKIDKEYIIAKSPKDAIKKASFTGFKSMILTGGSTLNSAFMKAGLINEIIINIEPAVLGDGIKLFREDKFYSRMKLVKMRKLPYGIVQLHYKVKKKV